MLFGLVLGEVIFGNSKRTWLLVNAYSATAVSLLTGQKKHCPNHSEVNNS